LVYRFKQKNNLQIFISHLKTTVFEDGHVLKTLPFFGFAHLKLFKMSKYRKLAQAYRL
jgi:hypothetical protein